MPPPALIPFTRFLHVAAAVEYGSVPTVYVNNLNDDGVYIEWKVEKTSKRDPDKLELSVFNLLPSDRKHLQAYAATPPGVPELEYTVKLSVGWDGQVMQLFEGNIRHIEADRAAKKQDRVNAVTFCRALDGAPTKEQSPGGGSKFAVGTDILLAAILGRKGLRISPDARKAVRKAAAKLPYDTWHVLQHLDDYDALDVIMDTLKLGWSIQDGKLFTVYNQGVNSEATKVFLSLSTGLVEYSVKDNGDVKFKALANPACVPGGPVTIYDKAGKEVGGGELRVLKVTFEGNTDGKSEMHGTAKKPVGL